MQLRPYIFALLAMAIVTLGIALLSCSINKAHVTKSFITKTNIKPTQYKPSERIEKAYQASLSLIVDTNNKKKVIGSGVIIRNKIHEPMVVLTAWHVVEAIHERQGQNTLIRVGLVREKQETLTWLIAKDTHADIALLMGVETQKRNGPEVSLAEHPPKLGEHIWVIGAHVGQERTVSECCLSHVFMVKNVQRYKSCANTYYGNSGGGVFNDREEVIGILHGHYLSNRQLKIVIPGSSNATALPHLKALVKRALL